jgi:heme/copper-type cytochrome/quinol oxidase subunit 2
MIQVLLAALVVFFPLAIIVGCGYACVTYLIKLRRRQETTPAQGNTWRQAVVIVILIILCLFGLFWRICTYSITNFNKPHYSPPDSTSHTR